MKMIRQTEYTIEMSPVEGRFVLSDATMELLDVRVEDNVIFFSNVGKIDEMLDSGHKYVRRYCSSLNLDISDGKVRKYIHKIADAFAIGKGFEKYDESGNPLKKRKKLTDEEITQYISENYERMVTAIIESGNLNAINELSDRARDRNSRMSLLKKYVVAPMIPVHEGIPVEEGNVVTNVGAWKLIRKVFRIKTKKAVLKLLNTKDSSKKLCLPMWDGNEFSQVPIYILTLI